MSEGVIRPASPHCPPENDQRAVLAFLARPEAHGLREPPQRIDTHAAVVFLAGDEAYKIKRAVAYPYLDFSTLERRKAACEAEIRLNRPGAPEVYIDTVPIVCRDGALHIGGDGEIVEWAVHMRRFDPDATLDRIAQEGGLDDDILADLVDRIVASHEHAPQHDGAAATDRIETLIHDNAAALGAAPELFAGDRVSELEQTWLHAFKDVRAVLQERGRSGHVRRCHGDLHLRNIALIDRRPVLFDALEFDDRLATSDLLYDLAFLLMDLWERGLQQPANAVLNRYLWQRNDDSDIAACRALPLFMSLRASIRAIVAVDALPHLADEAEIMRTKAQGRDYFEIAEACMKPAPPRLIAIGGLSGSGKTTVARCIAPGLGAPPGALHLRSDIERKRIFNVSDTTRLPEAAYTQDVTEDVYAHLRRKAHLALSARRSVIVDAVHDRTAERDLIESVASQAGAAFSGIWLEVEATRLIDRVTLRHGDASDADAEVVRGQLARQRDPSDWERIPAGGDPDAVCADVKKRLMDEQT